ncbi:MAG TPA: hypothetical protein VJJ80_03605 [Patescibacteria group bacterium]|nr:hypothetical protein [Patescibacteria group bacterium]
MKKLSKSWYFWGIIIFGLGFWWNNYNPLALFHSCQLLRYTNPYFSFTGWISGQRLALNSSSSIISSLTPSYCYFPTLLGLIIMTIGIIILIVAIYKHQLSRQKLQPKQF